MYLMKRKILIVEDEFIVANDLRMVLQRAGYAVCGIAGSAGEARSLIEREEPDLILLDIQIKGPLTGIDLARELHKQHRAFVYLSAFSSQSVLEAAKITQPYGFLVKPFREKDLLATLEIAWYRHEQLQALNAKKVETGTVSAESEQPFKGIIGQSPALRSLLDHIDRVAPTDTSVLILGESGTGKELVADCVHRLSPRRNKPFVKVNCAAMPANLIESELFGHEKGAFTGAVDRRIGKFEQASGGTILLDEIGELPLEMQVKLLRVLQEKVVERIGGHTSIKTDVRILAATNRNLEKEIAEGRFRLDLYYRLNVFPVMLPPLRERREDIALLARHFAGRFARQFNKPLTDIARNVLRVLEDYDWPGNIRELEHVLERSILLMNGSVLKELHLTQAAVPNLPVVVPSDTRIKTIEENEREHILAVLKKCKGRIGGPGGAAELLGVPPTTLSSKMKKLGIKKNFIAGA